LDVSAQDSRPNLLFIMSDDHASHAIGAYGSVINRTPHMDRIAARGTAFTHTYIQGGDQGAICICSRAMLLTGRSLFRAPHQPGPDLPLWPEAFRKAGYATFATGKWHNGPASFARCFTAGDSIFFGGMSDHRRVPVHAFDPSGKYARSGQSVGKEFSSELFTDAAIGFLRSRREDRPFFMYVSYTAPHDPRMARKKYADMYDPGKIALPPNFMPEHPFDNGELKVRDEKLLPWPRTPEAVRAEIAAYYAMITHVDHEIGRLLDALDETGRAGDTILVFAGDNGLAVGQHGLLGKQNLYEHSARVPLIIAAPGAGKPGTRSASLACLYDVFPTVCGLAGVAVPETVESKGLGPVLADPSAAVRDAVFGAYRDLQRMVRAGRHKLIWYPKIGKWQLFDVEADPWEVEDLAGRPEHGALAAGLRRRLAEEQARAGDPLPPAA